MQKKIKQNILIRTIPLNPLVMTLFITVHLYSIFWKQKTFKINLLLILGNHIGSQSLSSTDIIQSQSALDTENVSDQMESLKLETNPQSPEISLVEENPSKTDSVPVSIEPTKLDDNNDKSEFNVNSSSTLGIGPSKLMDSAAPSNLEDSVVPSILKDGVVSSTLEDPVSPYNLEDPVVPSNLEDPVVPSNLEDPVIPSNLEDPVIPSNPDPAVPSSRGGPAADEEDGFNKDKNIYAVKWIEFGLRSSAIITQNENGPCPLIRKATNLSITKYQF